MKMSLVCRDEGSVCYEEDVHHDQGCVRRDEEEDAK